MKSKFNISQQSESSKTQIAKTKTQWWQLKKETSILKSRNKLAKSFTLKNLVKPKHYKQLVVKKYFKQQEAKLKDPATVDNCQKYMLYAHCPHTMVCTTRQWLVTSITKNHNKFCHELQNFTNNKLYHKRKSTNSKFSLMVHLFACNNTTVVCKVHHKIQDFLTVCRVYTVNFSKTKRLVCYSRYTNPTTTRTNQTYQAEREKKHFINNSLQGKEIDATMQVQTSVYIP